MHSDSPNDSWAIRFAQFVQRFGTLKLSILFVVLSLVFTLGGSYVIRVSMGSQVQPDDFISAVVLTMLSAPWVLYFFSELIKQLENSRTNLKEVVSQLESLREEDVFLNRELQSNIRQLNHEIEQRKQAQEEREALFKDLEKEIQDKSEQEAQARRLSTLLRSIIDASPDLIYYRNEEGRFAGCNRIAELMTGKTEQELLGLTPKDVYEEELARQIVASDHEVLETNASITEELWLRFADGRRRYFEMKRVPFFDKDGNRIGLLSFGRDMTERKQAENAAAKASTDKTRFIATISHELRTPLNGIYGALQLIRRSDVGEQHSGLLDKAVYSTRNLSRIINDILDFSKIEAGKISIDPHRFSLSVMLDGLQSDLSMLAGNKPVALIFENHAKHDIWIGDAVRIRQVLLNIGTNAIKFTEQGKVTISARNTASDELLFSITDTGQGMSKDALARLFDRFEQADSSTTRKYGGTGLGMAITQSLVHLMHGKIRVVSTPGEGSRFIVTLPVVKAAGDVLDAAPDNDHKELDLSHAMILVAEDNDINRAVMEAMLADTRATLFFAENGLEAVEFVGKKRPDLVLMDIQMPVMDGVQACKEIKAQFPNLPVIALTADVMADEVRKYLQLGFDEHIGKPIDMNHLYSVLATIFRSH